MSIAAIQHIAGTTGLTPTAKLVALQLAAFHNHITGQCNPSPSSLSRFTGLSAFQVKQAVIDLLGAGVISRADTDFAFPKVLKLRTTPIPANFWPSDDAIQHIVEAYPYHHFSIEDATHEFITYFQRTGREAGDHNVAFIRNISALLDRRKAGQVTFSGDPNGNRAGSVRALLSGRSRDSGQQDVRGNARVRRG